MTAAERPSRLLPRAERQASILRAAATAFARGGYADTSMDDVAAEAGVTKLIVYRHFDSKEELYRAVLEQVTGRLAQEFVDAVGRGERKGVAARSLLLVARDDPDGFRLLWRHAAREPGFADYAERERTMVVEAARALLRGAPRWAPAAVVGFLVDAVLAWLEDGDPAHDERFVEQVTASLEALRTGWASARRR